MRQQIIIPYLRYELIHSKNEPNKRGFRRKRYQTNQVG